MTNPYKLSDVYIIGDAMFKFFTLMGLKLCLAFYLLILIFGWIAEFNMPPTIQRIRCSDGAIALWDRQHTYQIPLAQNDTCVSSVVWSPDGRHITFAQHDRLLPPELIISAFNFETRRLVFDSGDFYHRLESRYETRIHWSGDGEWLIFVVREGTSKLRAWVVKADGSVVYDYTDFIRYEPAVFFWSADNQHIYIRMVEFNTEMRKVHLLKIPVSKSPEAIEINEIPFPDTVWVYPTPRAGEMLALTESGLWLLNLDTLTQHLLAETSHWERFAKVDAQWSNDGELLAVLGRTKNQEVLLLIISRDGTDNREILIPVEGDSMPNWSITDFHISETVRITSPDLTGVTCTIRIHSENVVCETEFDSRRFIDRPPQR